jgi:hypothetical protein
MFQLMPVDHGQKFDCGTRRWCEPCGRPSGMVKPHRDRVGLHMGCLRCGVLWPEYSESFSLGSLTDDDIGEDFENTLMN